MPAIELPILDLSRFVLETELQRVEFAQLLVSSLVKHGFFELIDHGLSEASVQDLFDMVKFP